MINRESPDECCPSDIHDHSLQEPSPKRALLSNLTDKSRPDCTGIGASLRRRAPEPANNGHAHIHRSRACGGLVGSMQHQYVGARHQDPPRFVDARSGNVRNMCASVSWTRLSYLTVQKFHIVVETRRNLARIVRNRCVPVCGQRAGYFGLCLAQL